MKTISSYIYILALTIITSLFISQCTKSNNTIVLDIPDTAFLSALIDNNVDENHDGKIDQDEAEKTSSLSIGPSGIKSLKGIEAFIHLDSLTIHLNNIDTLDMKYNPDLLYLDCFNCEISSLNVSQNLFLEELYCSRNLLTTLDISSNTQLRKLILTVNKITELSLNNNLQLTKMRCCGNQLPHLDISKNTLLTDLGIDNMPMLTEVSVWALPFPPPQVSVLMGYSPNVLFTMPSK